MVLLRGTDTVASVSCVERLTQKVREFGEIITGGVSPQSTEPSPVISTTDADARSAGWLIGLMP